MVNELTMHGRAKVNRESKPGNSVRALGPTEGRNVACQTVPQFYSKFIPERLERKKKLVDS